MRLLKYMYGINNHVNLSTDELSVWLLETGFVQSQCKLSIYYYWEMNSRGKSINGIPMHAKCPHYGVCRENCFKPYVRISHVNRLASIDTSV